MGIDERVHDLAIVVFPMRSVGEIEVSAIVAKTIIIGIGVLPSPVLSRQLTVHRVLGGDVFAIIIVQGFFKHCGCVLGAHLNW